MGVEFFLVSDSTRDAYELGKGAWSVLDMRPITPDDLRTKIVHALGEKFEQEYRPTFERIFDELGAFMSSHPDWKLTDDTGGRGEVWIADHDEDLPRELGDDFTQVYFKRGSRYTNK